MFAQRRAHGRATSTRVSQAVGPFRGWGGGGGRVKGQAAVRPHLKSAFEPKRGLCRELTLLTGFRVKPSKCKSLHALGRSGDSTKKIHFFEPKSSQHFKVRTSRKNAVLRTGSAVRGPCPPRPVHPGVERWTANTLEHVSGGRLHKAANLHPEAAHRGSIQTHRC